jgi:hypothetical protein
MQMRETGRKIALGGMAAILLLFSISSKGFAGDRKASIMVSASVMDRVTQTVVRQAGSFTVTTESLKRGYVDVQAATVLQVQSNNPKGYLLSFEVDQEKAKEVWVMDSRRTTIISGPVGLVHQPYPGTAGEVKEISYRIFLTPEMKPGLHPWPLSVTASLQ